MANVKLVWFVPTESLEATRLAVFEAGAGRIGDYERCSWYTAGTGTFFGGEGTINVPCWSPDSRKIAFVTYQLIP